MNIKVVHLLTRPNDEREQRSISSISQLGYFKGIEYIKTVNPVYKELPPKDNCARPGDISMEPGHMKLSPAHYGCFKSHKEGILNNFTSDLDGILIFECDALITIDIEDFIVKLNSAISISKEQKMLMWTFGPNYGHITEEHNDFYVINKFLEAHAYYIPVHSRAFMFDFLENTPWDVIDLMYAGNFTTYKMGVFKNKPLCLQAKGYSFLDKKFSMYNGLGLEKI